MFFKTKRGMDFVDRGDPLFADFTAMDLIKDGTWRQLDLSAKIPITTRLVIIRLEVRVTAGTPICQMRKQGHLNNHNIEVLRITEITETFNKTFFIACGGDAIIEYSFQNATYTFCNLTVGGWWL